MPTPAKPCNGNFSEETIQALVANTDRAQWLQHRCEVCGQQIGGRLAFGKWSPDPHWPSVKYVPRTRRVEKRIQPSRNPSVAQPESSV